MKTNIALVSAAILVVLCKGMAMAAPAPSSVTVTNTPSNPVPVTVVTPAKKAAQLLPAESITIPAYGSYTWDVGDVSECQSLRLTVRADWYGVPGPEPGCALKDNDGGMSMFIDTLYVDGYGKSLMIQNPGTTKLQVVCYSLGNASPITGVFARLYCQ